ncbi:DUF1634 domain-containing protein [Chlamydiales bacterium]|nr:DUF1634 domain-containing protein [Chlamydiales bacterium]
MKRLTKRQLELFISKFYMYGVLLASATVLFGGIFFLINQWNIPVKYHIFLGEPKELIYFSLIEKGVFKGDNPAIIQTGVLMLMGIPIFNISLCLLYFSLKRDIIYIFLSLVVLLILLASFLGWII